MKRSTAPPKRILQELASGLEEIVNEFELAGFSEDGDEVARPEEANGQDRAEDDLESEEYESRRSRFPREDIEIGIDRFNSVLIRAKIATKQKTGRQPSLWQVFAILYGKDHPILEAIDRFEDHIKGYFGFVEYEQMRAAFDDILEVRDSVKRDLEGASG